MFGFGESKDAYEKVEQGHHASLSHEAIAAAASFEVYITPTNWARLRFVGHEGFREPPTR
jgi:hypothetical protein